MSDDKLCIWVKCGYHSGVTANELHGRSLLEGSFTVMEVPLRGALDAPEESNAGASKNSFAGVQRKNELSRLSRCTLLNSILSVNIKTKSDFSETKC